MTASPDDRLAEALATLVRTAEETSPIIQQLREAFALLAAQIDDDRRFRVWFRKSERGMLRALLRSRQNAGRHKPRKSRKRF